MTEPTTLLDLEFGDDGIVAQKHPDGMYTLDVSNTRLVLSAEQFDQIVGELFRLGIACQGSLSGAWRHYVDQHDEPIMADIQVKDY